MQVESSTRRAGIAAIHSVNRFVFSVPDIAEAERFYTEFGLDPRRAGERIDLFAHDHPHCWATIHANGAPKQLQYMSFGIFESDVEGFLQRIASADLSCAPHPLSDGSGLWLRDPDGLPNSWWWRPRSRPRSSHRRWRRRRHATPPPRRCAARWRKCTRAGFPTCCASHPTCRA